MDIRMSISIDRAVYAGLKRMAGRGNMSKFIEDAIRPHVMGATLEEGYQAMAVDAAREAEAKAWCDALAPDVANAAR